MIKLDARLEGKKLKRIKLIKRKESIWLNHNVRQDKTTMQGHYSVTIKAILSVTARDNWPQVWNLNHGIYINRKDYTNEY